MNFLLLNLILQAAVLAMAIPPVLNSQPYIWILKKLRLNSPPATCATCLGFWISLAMHLLILKTTWMVAIPVALMTGWLSNEADKIHTRLF